MMLPVSDVMRDQDGAPEFSADHAEGMKFATGIVTYGGGSLYVQVSEALVAQCGGDPVVVIQEEAFMVLMNAGNRQPDAFTRFETGGA